jgi:hypothetical protein
MLKFYGWMLTKKYALGSGCLISLVGYIYLNEQGKENLSEYIKSYEELRDATRPGYKSYGLNFGFKTDKTVLSI